jgi:hypothetical protein
LGDGYFFVRDSLIVLDHIERCDFSRHTRNIRATGAATCARNV